VACATALLAGRASFFSFSLRNRGNYGDIVIIRTLRNDSQERILVFDVGGSHIASSLFCVSDMSLGVVKQINAPAEGSPVDVFESFKSLATMPPGDPHPFSGISVAMPNPFDYEQGVSYMRHKYQLLYGTDLRKGLAEYLRCEPGRIHFLNDAAAFLIGELYQGAARGVGRAVGLTLGTGVGSAFAVDGAIVTEGSGVPPGGEIWNLPYGDSIVENVVSTTAIQRLYEQLTGDRAEVHEIASQERGRLARKTFEDFGRELGRVLRQTCLAFAPEKIIIGGGISRAASLFQQALEEELGDPSIHLSVSSLFDRAPLAGAGISWMQWYYPDRVTRGNAWDRVALPLKQP
jgi:glucokinase